MTKIELNILRHLYINPLEPNFTISILQNSLGMDKMVLKNNLQSLKNNNHVEITYTDGQKAMNDPGYRISGYGAKRLQEIDGKGIEAVVKKYGKIISLIISGIGIVGVTFQIIFGIRQDDYNSKQLQIQEQQLQIQQQVHPQLTPDTTHH